jgi:hypothetical protein
MNVLGIRSAKGAAAIGVLAVSALALSAALPADAHQRGSTRCPDRFLLCVWSDADFTGPRGGLDQLGPSNAIAENDNDNVSSLKLKRGYTATLFSDANGEGTSVCFDGVVRHASFLEDWNFNDQASSSLIQKGAKCPESTRCPDDARVCVWKERGFLGQRVEFRKRGLSNKLSQVMDNAASSVIANVKDRFFLYDGVDGQGDRACGTGGVVDPNLGAAAFEDIASSSRIGKPRPCPGP